MIPKTMKACMLTGINQFAIRELPVPTPGPFEVLCRIRAIAICGTDPEIVKGIFFYNRKLATDRNYARRRVVTAWIKNKGLDANQILSFEGESRTPDERTVADRAARIACYRLWLEAYSRPAPEKWTEDQLKAHVADKTPEWAWTQTTIRPEVIVETARVLGGARPASRGTCCRGLRRPLVRTHPGQNQSAALRLRPGADLRPGLPPRGGGLFRRKQISVSGRQHRRND